ncbi:dihydrofolate reductase family protein [Gordonia sp. (in: high G+C Gram-positive bacteria)]|uniref:dihydrofolate reductase family protein n=1 Tax=Gordonia sp. (in: high G+C Gram-positive bacteria) TaxID=84139 RepID=UPI0016AD632B|nr:dihydrofolate reductase family protein [Gordonia sp. (in: high G+C Gram-positive bacteria)]NLG46354.1 DNA-binding protein [Gordonia sp. (in: high G+C Gram-positive bacteria)]
MSKVRVHNLAISLDGYSAGLEVTVDKPIGDAAELFAYFDGRVIWGVDRIADPIRADHLFTSGWSQGIGVEIMGRRKFGPQSGPWVDDDDWIGWWGSEPPFRTPVVVLTHYEREPLVFENGTVFHFLNAPAAEALDFARSLADGDVRLGGGPSSVREFLQADLVDFMHLVTVPAVIGTGVSIWEGCADLQKQFDVESVTTGSGLTHQFWNRTRD